MTPNEPAGRDEFRRAVPARRVAQQRPRQSGRPGRRRGTVPPGIYQGHPKRESRGGPVHLNGGEDEAGVPGDGHSSIAGGPPGVNGPAVFMSGSGVSTHSSRSRPNWACASAARTRWPIWGGSKVPPKTPMVCMERVYHFSMVARLYQSLEAVAAHPQTWGKPHVWGLPLPRPKGGKRQPFGYGGRLCRPPIPQTPTL